MNKPHIKLLQNWTGAFVFDVVGDTTPKLDGYTECMNLLRMLRTIPSDKNTSAKFAAVAWARRIRNDLGYDAIHLVNEWMGDVCPNYQSRQTLVHIFMPNGLYGDTIKPHLNKE